MGPSLIHSKCLELLNCFSFFCHRGVCVYLCMYETKSYLIKVSFMVTQISYMNCFKRLHFNATQQMLLSVSHWHIQTALGLCHLMHNVVGLSRLGELDSHKSLTCRARDLGGERERPFFFLEALFQVPSQSNSWFK